MSFIKIGNGFFFSSLKLISLINTKIKNARAWDKYRLVACCFWSRLPDWFTVCFGHFVQQNKTLQNPGELYNICFPQRFIILKTMQY